MTPDFEIFKLVGSAVPWLVTALIVAVVVAVVTSVGVVWWCTRIDRRPLPSPAPLGKRHNPAEGRIIVVVGRLGAGKTSYAVGRSLAMCRQHKLPLLANCDVRREVRRIASWDDLAELVTCADVVDKCVHDHGPYRCPGCHPGVVLLDEAHLWMPSNSTLVGSDEKRWAAELLSWVRKRGWTLICTTQYLTRLSTEVRNLSTEIIEVVPYWPGLLHFQRMLDDSGRVLIGFSGIFSPRRADFNTRAEVTPLWSRGSPGGRRFKVK